jgi:hypothetical protein
MNRLEYFRLRVGEHILYKRLALKLSEAEFDSCVAFIEDNDHLAHLEFEYAINRMFLDRKDKPKNWIIIQELLMVANGCKLQPRHRSPV